MRPAHGSAAFQARASSKVSSRRTEAPCTTRAPSAKSRAAPSLSSELTASDQARTTLWGEGSPPPQPIRTKATIATRPAARTVTTIVPPMHFELTDEQREIQTLARDVAQAEIEPNAATWDREHRFPRELYGKLAELGLMGVCIPEEYGGAGADFLSYILVLEELSRADAGVGVTVAVHTSACTLPLLTFKIGRAHD